MTDSLDETALPADGHVHSEWSWDAVAGAMRTTCARAVELGLPALAFTEHVDLTPWRIDLRGRDPEEIPEPWRSGYADGVFTAPDLDVDGYLACVQECREAFPQVRILTGVELSEPHWHRQRVGDLLAGARFDRVLASVHTHPVAGGHGPLHDETFAQEGTGPVLRAYLAEVERLAEEFDGFDALAHLDYPVRYWPGGPQAFDPEPFAEAFRAALAALARSGRALEINTTVPLTPVILGWWRREGGRTVTFGSDAHAPDLLARGFREAAATARAYGFRPGRLPHDPWPLD